MPAIVELAEITRSFGQVVALDQVTFSVERGEFFSLLGPSGCGKTTLLRVLAGLDFPDRGSLKINERDTLDIPAHQRPVNTVFQSYALFPHMSVRDNVAFGLRMQKVARSEIQERVHRVMELTRIPDLAGRKPAELSGGQRQRVALARAVINEPEVLLLDEPLGALDLKLRTELQQELHTLQRRTGITFIYVTHDQQEALSMSDRIAVMNHGRLVQIGSPAEMYERPRNRFVAGFLGGCNLLAATVRERNGAGMIARTPVGELRLECAHQSDAFTIAIRPEKILLGAHGANEFTGAVVEATYHGAETQSIVRIGTATLRVVSINSSASPRITAGDMLPLSLPPSSLIVLED